MSVVFIYLCMGVIGCWVISPFFLSIVSVAGVLCVQYDVNKDGELEFLLTTSDGEIVFLHTNNSLLHGETIKVYNYTIMKIKL